MNLDYKKIVIFLGISFMMVLLFQMFETPKSDTTSVSYSDFLGMKDRIIFLGDNIDDTVANIIIAQMLFKEKYLIR